MSLNQEQVFALQSQILSLQAALKQDLLARQPQLSAVVAESGDSAQNDEMHHEELAQYLHQQHEWQALLRAQARLEQNSIDICSDCGSTIPYARLHAEPSAERCIVCQQALEDHDKRLHLQHHSSM